MTSDTLLLRWEESWSWACFSLAAYHSNPTGSYSDDRNKYWPQGPAIQLHNPSTPTLSQKDNNVNILILPTSTSLFSRLVASPRKEGGWLHSKHPRVGARSCVFSRAREWVLHQTGTWPSYHVCDPFQSLYHNRSKNPLGSRDISKLAFSTSPPEGGGSTIGAGGSEYPSSRLVLLLLLPRQSWAVTFTFQCIGFLM